MTTAAQLQAQLVSIAQQMAALRGTLLQEIQQTSGRDLAIARAYADKFRSIGVRGQGAQAISNNFWKRLGLPIPGTFPTAAALDQFNSNVSEMLALNDQAAKIYAELHPGSGISNWEVLGIMVALVAGGAAISAAAGEGAGAGAAAAGGSSAAAGGGAAAAAAGGAAAAAAPTLTAPTLAAVGTGAVSAAATSAEASASSALASAATSTATASTIASTVGDALTKLTGSSSIGNLVGGFLKGAGSLISEVESILSPLVNFGKTVLTDIQTLDTKYIEPMATLFTKEYSTIQGTIGLVETLSREGLQGILAIPQAIGGALSGLANGFSAAADATNANQSDLVKNTLAPAIATGVGEPIANLAGLFGVALNTPQTTVGEEPNVNVEAVQISNKARTLLSAKAMKLLGNGGLANDFWAGAYDIAQFFLSLAGIFEGALTASKYEGNNEARPEPLDQSESLEAWRRKIIDDATLETELGFRGFSASRIQVLKELVSWLPSERTALELFFRGVISPDNLDSIMAGHGLTKDDVQSVLKGVLEPVNPREAIAANGRLAMKQAQWLPESLGTNPPPEYTQLYPPRFMNSNIADLDWLEHWKIPDIEWWFVAYFRGLVTKEDVTNAAKAENWPVEVIDKMFAVRQELIQEWMIPDILASGVMTDQEALDYMAFAGIEPSSAQILLKWAHAKGDTKASANALALASKFEAQGKAMYEDGLINSDEYTSLLLEMGFNTEQASLMVGLADNEFNFSKRKGYANLLVKRVLSGQITLQDMQSALGGQGFTLKEVDLYVQSAEAALQDKTKIPSSAEVGDFLKKDIITYGEAVAAWRVDGWSDFWIGKLLVYYGGINITIETALGTAANLTVTGLLDAQASQGQPTAA